MIVTDEVTARVSQVCGRSFVRTSAEGLIDSSAGCGVFSQDIRFIRRAELFHAEQEIPVVGTIAIDGQGAAIRFDCGNLTDGSGVLLVVEFDGTDLFTLRDLELGSSEKPEGLKNTIGLGESRPDARVRVGVRCEGATLVSTDGVAIAGAPIRVDATARTASWRWDAMAPKPDEKVEVELSFSWALTSKDKLPPLRSYDEIAAVQSDLIEGWKDVLPVCHANKMVEEVLGQSIDDLASLRIITVDGTVVGSGAPWFLTVMGRDSLLTAWMMLPVDPEIAAGTLRYLARSQATEFDLTIDAEPGKIMHEERTGVAAQNWHERYFGSVDSTPLFVMLLAEHARWSGANTLAQELETTARAAIGWILDRIREDALGLLSFWRRAERGLDVQSWKDSTDSQRDSKGDIAKGLIRPIEVQGYAAAALQAGARLARLVWDDEESAVLWSEQADGLKERLVECGMVQLDPAELRKDSDIRREGFFAQSIDSTGTKVDSLCSNSGHLLWSQAIPDPVIRTQIVGQLTSSVLASGWGIRTMSTLDAAYDPTSYHCGSVWPHDTAICIAGIARYDRPQALELSKQLFEAAHSLGNRLPELFDGSSRSDDQEAPNSLSFACRPQAWASAAPFLVLRAVLGLEPDAEGESLVGTTLAMPEWLREFTWRGIHALGTTWDVSVNKMGFVSVERS